MKIYAFLVVAILAYASSADAANWDLTPLVGYPPYNFSSASSINDAGIVAGYTTDASNYFDPCVWNNGHAQIIASGDIIVATIAGINNSGQVAGFAATYSYPTTNAQMGFIYNDGSLTLLQDGDNANFYPAAINNAGLVVGDLPNGDAGTYDISTGVYTDFGQFGAQGAGFTALNNNGLIAGTLDFAGFSNIQAFVLYDGQKQILTGLNGVGTTPNAINDSGVIVGTATNLNGKQQAVSWIENGQQSTLLPLAVMSLPLLPGATASAATDINAAGDIVGWMQIGSDPGGIAVLWANGQVIDLNTLLPADSGWILNEATGINDSGQIVGEGTYNGEQLPFLLTPNGTISIPEPAAIPLTAGLCLLISRRREKFIC